MSERPIVTVLMPVYNGQKYIREAIDSILTQTFSNFELLIINDGSTDDSCQIIQSYTDPRIRLVQNETNLKLIETLNKGIKLSRGQYIARMDCDDKSMSERLAKQIAFMETHLDVGILGTGFCIIDSKGKPSRKVVFPLEHHSLCWDLCFYSPICHPSILIRKNVLLQVGGYDPEKLHVEDYDLWYRLSKKTKLANLPDILLYLRKHELNISSKNFLLHTENSKKINQRIISEILDEDVDPHIVECINGKKCKSWQDQVHAVRLIEKLRDVFVLYRLLSSEEIQLINKEASKRIFIVAIRRIFDFRIFNLLISALRLDKFVFIRFAKFLFYRYSHWIWPKGNQEVFKAFK